MDMIARFAQAIYDAGVQLHISKPRPWQALAGSWDSHATVRPRRTIKDVIRNAERTYDLDQYTANFAEDPEPVQFGEIAELGAAGEGDTIAVQIMRTGTFQEMDGKLCRIAEEDLSSYVANFEDGKAGQDLPVFKGHPRRPVGADEPAMAWYKRLYKRSINGVATLWADLNLTPPGRKAIEDRTFRYFSPVVNIQGRVLLGGGFTNIPAIKGQPAMAFSQYLTPVDGGISFKTRVTDVLKSLGIVADDTPPAQFSEVKDMAEKKDAKTTEQEAYQEGFDKAVAEFAAKSEEKQTVFDAGFKAGDEAAFARFTAEQVIRTEVAEFSATVTSGNSGLSVEADVVTAFLIGLTPEQREQAKALLEGKVADFSERGHKGNGKAGGRKELPEAVARALKQRLAGSVEDPSAAVAQFMLANADDLGAASEYNLSQYLPAE